jgi:hypothetical protein
LVARRTKSEQDGAGVEGAASSTVTASTAISVSAQARKALFTFIVTFVLSRVVVWLIMSGHIPNLYLFLHGTHIHHLNYGIFLLAAVSGYSVLCRPEGRSAELTAYAFGVAMALTFDEFGMWLHLGGSYWQRASVDAVIVVAALLALLGFAKSIQYYERHHFRAFICLAVVSVGFVVVLFMAANRIGHLMGPKLRELELQSSP